MAASGICGISCLGAGNCCAFRSVTPGRGDRLPGTAQSNTTDAKPRFSPIFCDARRVSGLRTMALRARCQHVSVRLGLRLTAKKVATPVDVHIGAER